VHMLKRHPWRMNKWRVLLNANGKKIMFVQIAGLIARRIICRLKKGETVTQGQRFGLIRFGSRVDMYLPLPILDFRLPWVIRCKQVKPGSEQYEQCKKRRLHTSQIYSLPRICFSDSLRSFTRIKVTMNEAFYVSYLCAYYILAAAVLDMMDGRVARKYNSASKFGIEYDSLCDLGFLRSCARTCNLPMDVSKSGNARVG
jgi:hypothetical protein